MFTTAVDCLRGRLKKAETAITLRAALLMMVGTVIALSGPEALGKQSELGLHINNAGKWGAVTGIIAGASSPLVGVAVMVAVERALGAVAGAWTACIIYQWQELPWLVATTGCLFSFVGVFVLGFLSWHAGKLYFLSLYVVLFSTWVVPPGAASTSVETTAAARSIGFIGGAMLLAVMWVTLMPTSATGQAVQALHDALQQLANLQAHVWGIVGVDMHPEHKALDPHCDIDSCGPAGHDEARKPYRNEHVPAGLQPQHDVSSAQQACPQSMGGEVAVVVMGPGAGERCVRHSAAELAGNTGGGSELPPEHAMQAHHVGLLLHANLLGTLKALQAMRHERALTIPRCWGPGRPLILMVPWRPLNLLCIKPPEPCIPQRQLDALTTAIGTMCKVMEIHSNFAGAIARVPGYRGAWLRHPRHQQLEAWMHASNAFFQDIVRRFPKEDMRVDGYVPDDLARALHNCASQVVYPDSDTAALCARLRPHFVRGMFPEAMYQVLRGTLEGDEMAAWEQASVYITVVKLLVEYVTEHMMDLFEAVNDFLEVVPGSACRKPQRPKGVAAAWRHARSQLLLQSSDTVL